MTALDYPVRGRGQKRRPFSNVINLWSGAVERAADQVAIEETGRQITYQEVWRSACGVAADLLRRDCRGARVAIVAPNGIDLHIAYLAALMAGATPALINPAYPRPQIDALLGIAAPRVVLASTALAPAASRQSEWLSIEDATRYATGTAENFPRPRPGDPAVLLFTGGTTGLSKAVVHSHEAMAHAVLAMEYVWPTRANGEVWLPIAPMSHIYGFLMGVLNPVYGAARIIVPPRFHPDLIIDMLAEHRVTVFGGGPAPIFAAMLATGRLSGGDLSSLAICPAGGAPTPVTLIDRWRRETGLQIYEAYGMTEIAPIAGSSAHSGQKDGSVGRPLPFNRVEIVDAETGTRVLPAGMTGEIRARGPSATCGYVDQPAETAQAFRDGWIYTGDLGYLDEDGFLFITDRKKDMLIVKGFNVFPRLVEEALLTHPLVEAATVVGAPDARTGERIVAFLIAARTADATEELRAHLVAHLPGYMVPAEFRFVTTLPMTAAGKPDRRALAQLAVESL